MKLRLGPIGAIVLATWSLMAGTAHAQPTLNPPAIVGANVTFTWSAAAGATSYDVQAAVAPGGAPIASLNVGPVTTIALTAPVVGIYYVRVVALPAGTASNEVQVVISSLVAPPAVPTPVQVFRNGIGNVILAWAPGTGGGPASGYRLRAGTTPGGAEVGVIPTNVAGLSTGGVPAGTYYLGVAAVNAGGTSVEAAEVALVMPANGACDAPPAPSLTTTAWGPFLTANWSSIPGADAYLFSYSGPVVGQLGLGGNQTSFIYPGLPQGTWAFGIQARFSCGSVGAVGQSNLTVDGSSLRLQPRAPDPSGPTPPNYIPLPNKQAVVESLAAQFPGEVQDSCHNLRFVNRVLNRLRQEDKRWGLNWKRNNVGDPSLDVLTYNYGSLPDEGSRQIHVVDIISGHCGPRPGPAWINQTVLFSSGATWTLIPYIQAGYTP